MRNFMLDVVYAVRAIFVALVAFGLISVPLIAAIVL